MITARLFLLPAIVTAFSLLSQGPLAAAPFCVEANGVPSECWYYDVRECKTEAAKQHARCSANVKEMKVSGAAGAFCIVDSAMAPQCGFQNWDSCQSEADKRSGAVCFQNNAKPNNDPYRFDRMQVDSR